MIKLAKEAGVDAVKFQTFKAEKYISVNQTDRFNRVKKFELSYKDFSYLANIAKKNEYILFQLLFILKI